MNDTTYEAGEIVKLRATRNDITVTVLGHEGPLVTVRVEVTGQIVKVPAGILCR